MCTQRSSIRFDTRGKFNTNVTDAPASTQQMVQTLFDGLLLYGTEVQRHMYVAFTAFHKSEMYYLHAH